MSKCSKKCNEIIEKIASISGLDDDWVYGNLLGLENQVTAVVDGINKYADADELNGTIFKDWEKDKPTITVPACGNYFKLNDLNDECQAMFRKIRRRTERYVDDLRMRVDIDDVRLCLRFLKKSEWHEINIYLKKPLESNVDEVVEIIKYYPIEEVINDVGRMDGEL